MQGGHQGLQGSACHQHDDFMEKWSRILCNHTSLPTRSYVSCLQSSSGCLKKPSCRSSVYIFIFLFDLFLLVPADSYKKYINRFQYKLYSSRHQYLSFLFCRDFDSLSPHDIKGNNKKVSTFCIQFGFNTKCKLIVMCKIAQ